MREIPSDPSRAGGTDAQLLSACRRGDTTAWPSLLDRYGHAIFFILLNRGLSRQDATNAFQTVCLLLANELPRLLDASTLPRWIVETTSRECVDASADHRLDDWCLDLLRDWDRRAGELRGDPGNAPPPDAMDAARTYFSVDGSRGDEPRGGITVVPTLVFDTMLTGGGAAERPDASDWRHLVYQAPPLSVDLQLQRGRRDRLVVTGKIRDTREARELSTSARILVVRGDTRLAGARCNGFGEFCLEFSADTELILQIDTNGVWAYIPLDRWPAARYTN
jgi:hypothetical protein